MKNETLEFENEIVYSIDELNSIINSYEYSKLDNSYHGIPIYGIQNNEPLPGEIFRPYNDFTKSRADIREFLRSEESKDYRIEASNLGRIKINGEIRKQYQETYGYLYIRITPKKRYHVYRIVAETWLKCPVEDTLNDIDGKCWVVHHISDNGFDNRPNNLLWMCKTDHGKISHKTIRDNELARNAIINKMSEIIVNGGYCGEKAIELLEDICLIGKETEKELVTKVIKICNIDIQEYKHIKWDKYK
jgi:hypothetical protein